MKLKTILIFPILTLILLLFPACDAAVNGSVKSLTHPYIGEYECVEGKLGEADLLEKYDYIKFNILDDKTFEMIYKQKDGPRQSLEGNYSVNEETREITGEIGIFGYKFKENIKIEKSKFTITKNIMGKPLIIKFKMK